MGERLELPEGATGLRLCKMRGDDLVVSEAVIFSGGAAAVDTVLRRAGISGQVGPIGETGDYWADILIASGDWVDTIALSRSAWNALKSKWMRCKLEPSGG